jgi:hypothetical protein
MSLKDKRCDVCGCKLPDMPPEVAKQQMAAALLRGDKVQNPDEVATVCDPCWQQAIRRGWKPGSGNPN